MSMANNITEPRTIIISDYTLRKAVGAGAELEFLRKKDIAALLAEMGVDRIELPALRGALEDGALCRTYAASAGTRELCLPAALNSEGIETAWEHIRTAQRPCLQLMLPASTVQLEYTCHLKAPAALELLGRLCGEAAAKDCGTEVIFRDASRAEEGFLQHAIGVSCENGASTVTLCDDAGILLPDECAALVRAVRDVCPARLLIESSDALRMGASCAIEALRAGADGVKTASGGDGLALRARTLSDILSVRGEELALSCALQRFSMHRFDACLEELLSPVTESRPARPAAPAPASSEELRSDSSLMEISEAIRALDYKLSDQDICRVYDEFRRLARPDIRIRTSDLEMMIAETVDQHAATYHLESYEARSGNRTSAAAQVILRRSEPDGSEKKLISGLVEGNGPIDAAFGAIEQITGHHYELSDYQIHSITEGSEAVGTAIIKLRSGSRLVSGCGSSTDIVGASVRAFINALNKIVYEEN